MCPFIGSSLAHTLVLHLGRSQRGVSDKDYGGNVLIALKTTPLLGPSAGGWELQAGQGSHFTNYKKPHETGTSSFSSVLRVQLFERIIFKAVTFFPFARKVL